MLLTTGAGRTTRLADQGSDQDGLASLPVCSGICQGYRQGQSRLQWAQFATRSW